MAERKTEAMKFAMRSLESRFLSDEQLKKYPISVGFSDDSLSNILSMKEMFDELLRKEPKGKYFFHLYFTGKKEDYEALKRISNHFEEREEMLILKF